MNNLLRPLLYLALVVIGCVSSFAQVIDGQKVVTATLVADTSKIEGGVPFTVGVLLKHAPDWHSYWQYSGDSGFATEVDWRLPEGFAVGPLQWPVPHRTVENGDMVVYTYGDEVLLMAEISPPAVLRSGELAINASVSWLVCKESCVPGSAEVSLTMGETAAQDNRALFERFRAQLPSVQAPPFETAWSKSGEDVVLTLDGVATGAKVDFFPLPPSGVSLGHVTVTAGAGPGQWTVTIPLTSGDVDSLPGLVVLEQSDGTHPGWQLGAGAAEPASVASVSSSELIASAGSPSGTGGILKFLLYGFIGGILLNLMPCVLPVISLKIFGFIKQADEEPAKVFRLGLSFVAGIFAWFAGLALVIAGLRMVGNDVSWSFQFQNPYFNIFMSAVVFVFALNLFGVFEVYLTSSANNKIVDLAQREGYAGAFLHGVFATILATPCTAPFLGPALGFAFSQSSVTVFVMFLAIAAGMGAPFILLSARPGWMKHLPRPGKWMEQVKQFMGFLLLVTMLWLLRVLGYQLGVDALIWICGFLLMLGVACWVIGSFITPVASKRVKHTAWIVVAALVLGGGWSLLGERIQQKPQSSSATMGFRAELDEALAGDQVVFVDFTAEWCLTCKFNERTVVHTPEVESAMKEHDVRLVVADWTSGDAEISAMLKEYGRAGVPFYLVFPPGGKGEAIALPEVITKEMLINAFAEVAGE